MLTAQLTTSVVAAPTFPTFQPSVTGLIGMVALALLWAWGVIDVWQTERTRLLVKEQWVWIVVLCNVFGVILWLLIGRPRR